MSGDEPGSGSHMNREVPKNRTVLRFCREQVGWKQTQMGVTDRTVRRAETITWDVSPPKYLSLEEQLKSRVTISFTSANTLKDCFQENADEFARKCLPQKEYAAIIALSFRIEDFFEELSEGAYASIPVKNGESRLVVARRIARKAKERGDQG